MRRMVLTLALVLAASACGGSDADEPATTTTTSAAPTTTTTATTVPVTTGGPAVVVLSEVVFGDDGYVAITNHGESDGDLDGWQLCQRPAYYGLPAMTIGSGETIKFALGDASALEGNVIEMGRRIGQLRPTTGEVGLYSSGSFGDPEAIVSYVEWGEPDHGRSSTAVDAGVWGAGEFVATNDATAGISKTTAEPISANDWTPSG